MNQAVNATYRLTNIPGIATMKYKDNDAFDPVGNVNKRVINGMADNRTSKRLRFLSPD